MFQQIPIKTMTKETPTELYQALAATCKRIHQQRGPPQPSGDQRYFVYRVGE